MAAYILKRLLIMIPTMCGILVVSFCMIILAPGDPAAQKFGGVGQASAGMDAQRGTESAEKRFRDKYHLDEPIPYQFYKFLERLFTGNLAYMQQEGLIWDDLFNHLQVTVGLNVVVFLLIYMFAVPIGILSAAQPESLLDRGSTILLFVLYSLPSFWVASMLQLWFSDQTAAISFPTTGLHSDGYENWSTYEQIVDVVHHCVLPIICLTYGGLAYISRQMRAGMLEVIRQDYIRTAEAKGASKARVILVHALRNGLFPIITLFASLLPFLVGGSVIIERIFNIPGMGWYAFEGILRREYDVVMITLILSAVLTLLGILVADIMYVLVNPQVSFDKSD